MSRRESDPMFPVAYALFAVAVVIAILIAVFAS